MAMCPRHANRASKGVDLYEQSKYEKTETERLLEKVDKNGGIPSNPYRWDESMGECWIWKAARRGMKGTPAHNYGAFRMRGKQMYAHRAAYLLLVGEIEDGMTLDHLCRVPLCVNPGHLEPCTIRENQMRREAMRTHCKNGHEMTAENTYTIANYPSRRYCKECRRNTSRRHAKKRRG